MVFSGGAGDPCSRPAWRAEVFRTSLLAEGAVSSREILRDAGAPVSRAAASGSAPGKETSLRPRRCARGKGKTLRAPHSRGGRFSLGGAVFRAGLAEFPEEGFFDDVQDMAGVVFRRVSMEARAEDSGSASPFSRARVRTRRARSRWLLLGGRFCFRRGSCRSGEFQGWRRGPGFYRGPDPSASFVGPELSGREGDGSA